MNPRLRNILEALTERYLLALPLFIPFALLTGMVFFLYRLEVHGLMGEIYSGLKSTGFIDYLGISLHFDAVIIIITLAVMLIVFMATGNRKAGLIAVSGALFSQGVGLLMGIEFFRVYETTMQTSYWSSENATALSEMMHGYFAEASFGFYWKSILLLVTIIFLARLLQRAGESSIIENIFLTGSRSPLRSAAIYFPPVTGIILILMILFAGSEKSLDTLATREGKINRPLRTILFECSLHPIYNMYSDIDDNGKVILSEKEEKGTGDEAFEYRLDTASLATAHRFPRIGAIPRGKKYNIIFYFFESTPRRYIDYKVNGKYIMPTWRRLMKHSVISENHYANYPLSANAMLSILTSAYDFPGKKLIIQKHSSVGLTSLPEILKSQGYRTCIIHTGDLRYAGQRRFLKYRSFDRIIDLPELENIPPYNYRVGWGVDERAMIEPTVRFMKQKKSQPFFTVYMPVNPHHPYAIPDKKFQITGPIPRNISSKERVRRQYLNSLYYSDAALGELIARLEKEGLMKNTLLFLFADHGEAFYEHVRNYNHPFFLYEENVQVPLIIYNRELISEPVNYRGITRHIDIMPTVLDILQLKSPPEQEGISFLAPHRQQLALLHTHWKDDYTAVRDGQWKYIRDMKRGFEELYNLEADPFEKNNVAASQKDLSKKYRKVVTRARRHKREYYRRVLYEKPAQRKNIAKEVKAKTPGRAIGN